VHLIGGDKMCAPLAGRGGEDDFVQRGPNWSDRDGNSD